MESLPFSPGGGVQTDLPHAHIKLPLCCWWHVQVEKGYVDVFGVLGLARLEAGPALVVVTAIEQVGRRMWVVDLGCRIGGWHVRFCFGLRGSASACSPHGFSLGS